MLLNHDTISQLIIHTCIISPTLNRVPQIHPSIPHSPAPPSPQVHSSQCNFVLRGADLRPNFDRLEILLTHCHADVAVKHCHKDINPILRITEVSRPAREVMDTRCAGGWRRRRGNWEVKNEKRGSEGVTRTWSLRRGINWKEGAENVRLRLVCMTIFFVRNANPR